MPGKNADAPVGDSILMANYDDMVEAQVVDEISGLRESYVQSIPSLAWSTGHTLGRVPQVSVTTDEPVEILSVTASEFTVIAVFAAPATGRLEFN